MKVEPYLKRISYDKPVKPDLETLIGLHYAHMLTVPFENLDIHLGNPIELSEKALWDKLIIRNRGGFCYELNGMFAWLLKRIGFEVTYLNGRVYNDEAASFGREFDHLTLMVRIPGEPTRLLADVGFGDSFVKPLRIDFNGDQAQGFRAYRLEKVENGIILWRRGIDGNWKRQYFFDLQARSFPSDFEESCNYHQLSPQSSFTQERLISRATPNGRITLDSQNLTITTNGQQEKHRVKNNEEYQDLMERHFSLVQ